MATTFKLDKVALISALNTTLTNKKAELAATLKEQAAWEASADKRQAAHEAAILAWRRRLFQALAKDPTLGDYYAPYSYGKDTFDYRITVPLTFAKEYPRKEEKHFSPAHLQAQVEDLERLLKMLRLTTTDTVSSSLVAKFQQYL